MSSFLHRFPTRQELFLMFLVCLFPINLWAFIAFLRKVPSYTLRFDLSEIFAILSYTLSFALLESIMLLSFLVILGIFSPKRFLLDRFISQGTILVAICSLWMVPVHYRNQVVSFFSLGATGFVIAIGIWLITFIIALIDLSILLRRYPKFEAGIISFVDRLSVLSIIYLFFDFLGLLIVLHRNIL